MRHSLNGRKVLITGASSGIGRSLAIAAADRGARVAFASRSGDKLRELQEELETAGRQGLPIQADVTLEADRQRMIDLTGERFGGLDVLVNNAGIASFGHFVESSEEHLRRIMEVNFFAPAELIRTAIPKLRASPQPAIVNVSSMCGRRGMPAWPEYSASKSALVGLTEALAAEMARFDIHVLLVVPGLTRTGLREHLLRDAGRMNIDMQGGMTPEYVADQVWRALERGRREIVLGWEAKWILRMNRFLPRLVDRLSARKVKQLYAMGG